MAPRRILLFKSHPSLRKDAPGAKGISKEKYSQRLPRMHNHNPRIMYISKSFQPASSSLLLDRYILSPTPLHPRTREGATRMILHKSFAKEIRSRILALLTKDLQVNYNEIIFSSSSKSLVSHVAT